MINSFLVSLTNVQTQPVISSSTTGNIYWPAMKVRTFTGAAAADRQLLFKTENSATYWQLVFAIQYLWVVQGSILINRLTIEDPRITYDAAQLKGQLTDIGTLATTDGVTDYANRGTYGLSILSKLHAGEYLEDDLRVIYTNADSPVDRLAAVICYFGAASE